jgi:hypothetical protein
MVAEDLEVRWKVRYYCAWIRWDESRLGIVENPPFPLHSLSIAHFHLATADSGPLPPVDESEGKKGLVDGMRLTD